MCGTATGWAKMAMVCLILGMALHIAGWATQKWMTYKEDDTHAWDVGLWRQKDCRSKSDCKETAVESLCEMDKFNAVRALETITFCVLVFAAVMIFIYVFVEAARRRSVAIVLMVVCFLTGTISFVGTIIWTAFAGNCLVEIYYPYPKFTVSFSMGLTVIAFLLVLIAGVLLIPDVFEPHEIYHRDRTRSDMVTPYTPPNRRGVVTPLSYRNYDGPHSYRW